MELHDEGHVLIADVVGHAHGPRAENLRHEGADKHGEDDAAGADAELGFEFHAVL
jgi:hypothetical protein